MRAHPALPALLMTVVLAALSRTAGAGAWNLAPGEYYSEFRSGFFSADTYHNPNGDRLTLFGGGLQEERSLLSYTELGWKKRVSFILGIPARSVVRRFGSGADTSYRPAATGLADGLVGFRYGLVNGKTALAIELDWKPPLGYDRSQYLSLRSHADSVRYGDTNGDGDSLDVNRMRQSGTPRLGDGQQDLTLALHVGTALPFMRGFFQASGGYRYRFEDPADQIVASADLGVWILPSLMLAGRYQGEIAANEEGLPTADPDRHLAGPMLLYRVDDRLDVFASSLHTAMANNALHTDEIFVGVAFKNTKLNRQQGFLGGLAGP